MDKLKYYKKAVVAFLMTFIAGSPLAGVFSDFNLNTFLGLVVTGIITAVAVAMSTNGPDPSNPGLPEAEPFPTAPPVTG